MTTTFEEIKSATLKLLDYCRKNDWSGYDPYDALNSEIFKRLSFLDSRIPRLVLTQALKRFPFNLRPLLLIPKTQNPKAIALFLMALIKLSKLGPLEDTGLIQLMVQKLIDLRSQEMPVGSHLPSPISHRYWNWGYSFPWQTRTIVVPRGAPNLVCTVFVANALLDLYESSLLSSSRISGVTSTSDASVPSASSEAYLKPPTSHARYLSMAVSAAEYILNELYWTDGDSVASFSYPLPSVRTVVHNANFLGAALLCRIYKHTGDEKFLAPALKAARYSAAQQYGDGSWNYGEASKQQWVDNFHTGYNLCALQAIGQYGNTQEFEPHVHRGFAFYRNHFFREDGAPKYFHNHTYPIDIHSVAQSILTLLAFKDFDKNNVSFAQAVYRWSARNMSNSHGHYYYQKLPYYTVKIPYMRWSQAWMLLALSTLLETVRS